MDKKRKKNVAFKIKVRRRRNRDAINSIGKFRVWKEQSTEFCSKFQFFPSLFFQVGRMGLVFVAIE